MAFALRPAIQSLQPDLVAWRRDFHRYPELGFREYRTAQQIADRLTQWGIPHRTGVAQTGIVAEVVGTKPVAVPKVLALRADMDALPIQEDNPDLAYSSQHAGVQHACGHDGHVAIALGTAQYLWHHRERFGGTVKILFQPAEEGPGGAQPMIEAGVLQNPPVDGILGLHLWNNLPLGTVG
ncbi:MAG: amidohydrolase, partial [Pseudanabaenaceae cyanobacterium]